MSSNESSRCRRPLSSGATEGSSSSRTHAARSLICIAHSSAMFLPLDLRRQHLGGEAGAGALRAGLEGDRPLDEAPHVRLHRLGVLGQHRLLDPGDHALEGEVDALDLDLGRGRVEHRVELLGGERRDGLVHGQAHALEQPAVPAVHRVPRHREGALAQRLGVVVERRAVDVADVPHALAARAHAAEVDGGLDHGLLDPAALVGGHHAARRAGGDVEREGRGRADVRCAEPAEQDAQHRVGVGGGADRGARVGPHPLLVDDDRGRQALEVVDVGARQVRHEALHEGAVGLVDHPLRLGGDGREHQGALARPGHPGEHGEAPLGQLDADVLQVVLAGPLDADQVVTVGDLRGRGLRAGRHRASLLRSGGCRDAAPAVVSRPAQTRRAHPRPASSFLTRCQQAAGLSERCPPGGPRPGASCRPRSGAPCADPSAPPVDR